MPVKVSVFSTKILEAMHNPENITATGKSVGECLMDLVRQYPEIEKLIFDNQKRLRREVFVFVNAESLHKAELSKPLKEKDVLILAVLMTGG